jgi:hypothetical protein
MFAVYHNRQGKLAAIDVGTAQDLEGIVKMITSNGGGVDGKKGRYYVSRTL